MMGGALGLAALASLSAARTESLLATGAASPSALTSGYQWAFAVAAAFAALAAALAWLLPAGPQPASGQEAVART
jgi:hypothetical protein